LPTGPTADTILGRLKVEAVGNIFFDINHSNFTVTSPTAAPATISGKITTTDGASLAGVTVNLSGGKTARTITDSNGDYRFENMETGLFYTVTPTLVNYHF